MDWLFNVKQFLLPQMPAVQGYFAVEWQMVYWYNKKN
jgi:hypothetical protein